MGHTIGVSGLNRVGKISGNFSVLFVVAGDPASILFDLVCCSNLLLPNRGNLREIPSKSNPRLLEVQPWALELMHL